MENPMEPAVKVDFRLRLPRFPVGNTGERLFFGLALAIFFASGFAALLYQVIWQRMLGLFSGVDIYSVTIIVAAYMAGLGCGSLAGGHLADQLSRRFNLLVFAGCELAIALFALISKALYYDVRRYRGRCMPICSLYVERIMALAMAYRRSTCRT